MGALTHIIFNLLVVIVIPICCYCDIDKPDIDRNITIRNEFPLAEFLNSTGIPPDLPWDDFQCFNQSFGTTCKCNPGCQTAGDCCIDFMWNHTIATINSSAMDEILNTYKNSLRTAIKDYVCLPLLPFISIKEHFLMVASCLPNTDIKDKDLCTVGSSSLSNKEQIPVLGSDGTFYKNMYCARCNGVSIYKEKLLINVKCTSEPEGSSLIEILEKNTNNCEAQYGDKIFRCNKHYCDPDLAKYCTIFKATFAPKSGGGLEVYRNPYCYKCLKNIFDWVQFKCLNRKLDGWTKTISLDIFNENEDQCKTGFILNSDSKCVKKYCGLGYNVMENTCQRSYPKIISTFIGFANDSSRTIFESCLVKQHPHISFYIFMEGSNISTSLLFLENAFSNIATEWSLRYSDQSISVFKAPWFASEFNLTEVQKIVAGSDSRVTKGVLTSSYDDETFNYGFDLEGPRICFSVESIDFNNKNNNNNNTSTCQYIDASIKYKIEIYKSNVTRKLLKCHKFHLHSSCFRELLSYRNFSFSENGDLTITTESNITETHGTKEYEPATEVGLQICLRLHNKGQAKYTWQPVVEEVSYVISWTGTILSIIAHIAFVLCFVRFRALRNIGGMHILVLVIFLMISDIISVPTLSRELKQNTNACKWLGILLYWALLAVCGWSVVVAVDLGVRFAGTFSLQTGDDVMKTLYRRIALNLAVASFIAVTVTILDETETIVFDFKSSCWIGRYELLLVFYFVPILLVYFVFVAELIVVLWSVNRTQKLSKQVLKDTQKRKDHALVSIGAKLVAILGVTECFGLIQIRKSAIDLTETEAAFNAAFGLIYNITRSLRGLLVFVVYLMNEKTLNVIKRERQQNNTIGLSNNSVR